jgi:hypothetical protein
MKDLRGEGLSFLQWLWLSVSFGLAAALSVAAVILPMRMGEKHLGAGDL